MNDNSIDETILAQIIKERNCSEDEAGKIYLVIQDIANPENLTFEEAKKRYDQLNPIEKRDSYDGMMNKKKNRVRDIKLISKYFGINYLTAQIKYKELYARGELEETLIKAKSGEQLDTPSCPKCGSEMRRRSGRLGDFWGCTNYPDCRGTRPIKSELLKITEEQKKELQRKNEITMKFIDDIGGVDEAIKWISIISKQVSNV